MSNIIPRGFSAFAGKENLIASFNNFLIETIEGGHLGAPPLPSNDDFFWVFDYPIQPQQFPAITTTELGLFNLGEQAFDQLLGFTEDGDEIKGARNQTLIEITCIDTDSETKSNATLTVRKLRDKVMQALNTQSIPLRDYNNPNKPVIGFIELDPSSNSVNEKYIVNEVNQQVKRYVLVIRIFWIELIHNTKTATINSDAQVI